MRGKFHRPQNRSTITEYTEKGLPKLCRKTQQNLESPLFQAFFSTYVPDKAFSVCIKVSVFIDPPYNTGAKDWKYSNDYVDSNDTFRHSKWLSMMNVRLLAAKTLLTSDGALVCAIDENEQATTGLLLEEIFGEAYNIDCITVVHNPGGIQGANFSYCHEYAYFVYPRRSYYIKKERREGDDLTPFRDWGKENSKRTGSPNCFYPIITDGEKILSFGDVPPEDFHPTSANEKHGTEVWIWPIDKNGIERRWRFARNTVEEIRSELVVVSIRGELNIQRNKQLFTRKTVWNDARFSANIHGTQLWYLYKLYYRLP